MTVGSDCFDFALGSSVFIEGKFGVGGLDGIPSLESDSIAGESSILAESESLNTASIWSFWSRSNGISSTRSPQGRSVRTSR